MFSPPIAKLAKSSAINSGKGGTHLDPHVKDLESSYDPARRQVASAVEQTPFDFANVPAFPSGPPGSSSPRSRAGGLSGVLQTKLAVGSVHDDAEAEADAMAIRALGDGNMGAIAPRSLPAVVQRKCGCSGSGEKCDACKDDESRLVQRKATCAMPAVEAPAIVHCALGNAGHPLDAATRAYMEPRFGFDFSQVRIHSDALAAQSANAIQALAYTVNNSIAFSAGSYAPETASGRRLLAHELAHVIQQRSAPALAQDQVAVGSAHDAVEQDAEQSARTALSGGAAAVSQPRLSSAAVIRRAPAPAASDTWTTQQDLQDIREAKPPLQITEDGHPVTVNVTRQFKQCNAIKTSDKRSAWFYNSDLDQLAIDHRTCTGNIVIDEFAKEFQDSQAKGVEVGAAVNIAGDKTQGRVEVGGVAQDENNVGGVGARVQGSLKMRDVDLNVTGKYVRNILNKGAGTNPNEVDASIGVGKGDTSIQLTGTNFGNKNQQVGISVGGTLGNTEKTQCHICFTPAPKKIFKCTKVVHPVPDQPKPDTPEQKPTTLTPEYRMYFAWDSWNSAVPPEEDYLKSATADNMKKMKEDLAKPGFHVTAISGYASPEGSERKINRPLAQKRAEALAEAVRQVLRDVGRGSEPVPEPAGHSELLGNKPAPPSAHLRDVIAASGKHSAEEITALLTGAEIPEPQMASEFLDLFKQTTPDEWMQLFGLDAGSSLRSEVQSAVNAFIASKGKGKRPWEHIFRPLRFASVQLQGTDAPKAQPPSSSKPAAPASPDSAPVPVNSEGMCNTYGETAEEGHRFGPAINESLLKPDSSIVKDKEECRTAPGSDPGTRTPGCDYEIPKKSDKTAPAPPAPSIAPNKL